MTNVEALINERKTPARRLYTIDVIQGSLGLAQSLRKGLNTPMWRSGNREAKLWVKTRGAAFEICNEVQINLNGIKTISKINSGIIASVFAIRDYQPPNLRGRCAFGRPCDDNFISYGCEKFNDHIGLCWSECTGNLPKNTGEGGFVYQGWCYNMNSALVTDIFSGKSGKSGKSYWSSIFVYF